MPVRCKKLWTRVSMAIMPLPVSNQCGRRGPKQQPGEGHGEDLVGDPVDIPQRPDQPLLAVCGEVYAREDRSGLRIFQPVVDPADQVIVGNVTDKEKKAVSGLVEAAVPQRMAGQRAGLG